MSICGAKKLSSKKSKVLELVLCNRWFDTIARGEKHVEWRHPCDYWNKRLAPFVRDGGGIVRFHRGYTATTITCRITRVCYRECHEPGFCLDGRMAIAIEFEEITK